MDKKAPTEAGIRTRFIAPAILGLSGDERRVILCGNRLN